MYIIVRVSLLDLAGEATREAGLKIAPRWQEKAAEKADQPEAVERVAAVDMEYSLSYRHLYHHIPTLHRQKMNSFKHLTLLC